MSKIQIFKDADVLADSAAQTFVDLAKQAIADHGYFSVALSGGSTPKKLHKCLAETYKNDVDWSKVFVFLSDERFVPPYDELSNYYMANETLLELVPIPDENIFPFVTMDFTVEEAAELYETELNRFFTGSVAFDLIMLGLGPDGHTASLFPNQPEVLNPSDSLVVAVHDSPKPPATRLTFSYKLLNQAKNVLFLAGGQNKAEVLKSILEDEADLPATKVKPSQGNLFWFLDEDAASELNKAT